MTTPLAALRDFFVAPPEAALHPPPRPSPDRWAGAPRSAPEPWTSQPDPEPSASVTPLNSEPLASLPAPERWASVTPRITEPPAPLPRPCVAVLARASDCGPATAVVALALARADGARCAVAAGWRVDWSGSPRLGAVGGARQVALRLDALGLAARATGRLVRVRLPDDPAAAAAGAERAVAGASCPIAIGLAGPREPELDELLASTDLVVIVQAPGADAALARAVEAGLAHLSVPVTACRIPTNGPLRALAAAGVAIPRSTRESVLTALDVVRREDAREAAVSMVEAVR